MDERNVWCFFRKGLEGQGNDRGAMAALFQDRDTATLKIVRVDKAFFASSQNADDTTEGRSLLEERQKVGDKAIARVDNQRRSVV